MSEIDLIIKRLKQAIDESGLTYSQLESKTGISKSALQRYATGMTKKIPVDTIVAIAQVLNVSAAWIMGWSEEDNKSNVNFSPATDDDIKFALFGGEEEITDEMYDEVKNFAEYVKHTGTCLSRPSPNAVNPFIYAVCEPFAH